MNTTLTTRAGIGTARLERLRDKIREHGWAGVLVTDLVDIRYLSGLDSSNAALLITLDSAVVITDFRYVSAASSLGSAFTVRQVNQALYHELGQLLGEVAGSGAIAYSPSAMSHRAFLQLTEGLASDLTLRAVEGAVGDLRMVKEAAEIAAVERASSLLTDAYGMVATLGLAGRSEREVAWLIERFLREAGASALSFDLIVAGGEHGSLPHHHPSDDPIPNDTLVTVDIGCVVDGYCSDCTRTFPVGSPSNELRDIYDITLRAQLASLDAIRSGVTGRDVDAIARDIITAAGHGDHFGHGLGHGVGLQVHEGPRLSRASEDTLDAGMLVTVEPGIYVPGLGGVRIEDLVVVTSDGYRSLTTYPKEYTPVS